MAKKDRKKKRDGLFLRGEIWCLRRVVNGVRKTVTTGCKDRRQAERRATEIEKDQNDGIMGWKPEPKKIVPTIEQYIATSYESYYRYKRTAEKTLAELNKLAAAFPGRRLETFTMTECQGYLNGLGCAQNSARDAHIKCAALFARAIGDNLIEKNPWKFRQLKPVPRARVMSFEEQVMLFPLLAPSARRAVTVCLFSGLRNDEVCNIERRDVDWIVKVIHVRREVGKGKEKARVVPLTAESAAAIREQIAGFDQGDLAKFFPTYRDGEPRIFPYQKTSLASAFWRAVQTARIPPLTVHDMRRTFATRFAENGTKIRRLQEILGHSDVEMTAKFYTPVDVFKHDDINEALVKMRQDLADATPGKVLPMPGEWLR